MRKSLAWMGTGVLMACVFDTRPVPPFEIEPDLYPGAEWMYVHREFLRAESGQDGDTAIRFIHYQVTGDTIIAGSSYRVLEEEDLAYYNFDLGLVLNRLRFAVRNGGGTWEVKQLRGPRPNTAGRLPLKAGAFDTVHFEDEVVALSPMLSWDFRGSGHPLGRSAARKTYLGKDSIFLAGKKIQADHFRLEVASQQYIRFEDWYADGVKVFATSAYAASMERGDSLLTEEEWIGKRGFTAADTQAVLKAALFE